MNLEENCDAVERKSKVDPRAIGKGDVLYESGVDAHFLLTSPLEDHVQLVKLQIGRHGCRCPELGTFLFRPLAVGDVNALTRAEVTKICGRLADYRLVGRAADVLTVQDPGE